MNIYCSPVMDFPGGILFLRLWGKCLIIRRNNYLSDEPEHDFPGKSKLKDYLKRYARIDVLKIPHHGSINNVEFKAKTADGSATGTSNVFELFPALNYVFSGVSLLIYLITSLVLLFIDIL
jgi:hypothetical protein